MLVNDLGGSLGGKGGSTRPAQAVVDEITAAGGTAAANFDSVEDGAKIVQAGEMCPCRRRPEHAASEGDGCKASTADEPAASLLLVSPCPCAAVDLWGKVDILINNAGILRDVSFHKMSDADW